MNILFIHEIDWLKKVVTDYHSLSELLSLSGHQVYTIDYEGCEECHREEEHKGWENVTKLITLAKEAVFKDIDNYLKRNGYVYANGETTDLDFHLVNEIKELKQKHTK